ncbi:MAG: hypothetical protein K9J13_06330 [Saprospiraceae bacterium]|nr:hypothetical protein [Saprospiraceae bacterium]
MKEQNILIELLHNKGMFIEKTLNNRLSNKEFKTLFFTSILFFAIFGFIIGSSHSFPQALVSSLKLPVLFLISTLICFPTLYFFLAILGLKQNFYQLFSYTLVCLTIISGVLLVFAPISFFFLITTSNYYFFKLLNVIVFAIAGFVGIYVFYKNINIEIDNNVEVGYQKRIRNFLKLWLILFGFIGCQLSYTLSPFFGLPDEPFILFTKLNSNFYVEVLQSISRMF